MLSGNVEVVALLITRGADICHGNNEGEQPIHLAAAEDHSDIIVMLAKGGKYFNRINFREFLPFSRN